MTSWQPGALIAENTQRAPHHLGPCICGHAMLAGDRVARLTDGTGRWVHVGCCRLTGPPHRERIRTRAGR